MVTLHFNYSFWEERSYDCEKEYIHKHHWSDGRHRWLYCLCTMDWMSKRFRELIHSVLSGLLGVLQVFSGIGVVKIKDFVLPPCHLPSAPLSFQLHPADKTPILHPPRSINMTDVSISVLPGPRSLWGGVNERRKRCVMAPVVQFVGILSEFSIYCITFGSKFYSTI